jgi:hypothetical protein
MLLAGQRARDLAVGGHSDTMVQIGDFGEATGSISAAARGGGAAAGGGGGAGASGGVPNRTLTKSPITAGEGTWSRAPAPHALARAELERTNSARGGDSSRRRPPRSPSVTNAATIQNSYSYLFDPTFSR